MRKNYILISATCLLSCAQMALAASIPPFTGTPTPGNPSSTIPNTPPPTIIPDPGPKIPVIPVIPTLPQQPPLTIVPLDLIQPIDSVSPPRLLEVADAMRGLSTAAALQQPDAADNGDGILVRKLNDSTYDRQSACSVKLTKGTILVSVRRPSKVAIVSTDLAEASLSSDSDVEVRYEEGTMRLINLSGLHQSVRVQFNKGAFPEQNERVVSIAPGYELTLGDHKLHKAELKPADGYARRSFKVLENGHLAISQISVESVLKGSDLIASLNQTQSDKREHRILADMSKMAAVLNYINGSAGFETQAKASLSVNSQLHDKN